MRKLPGSCYINARGINNGNLYPDTGGHRYIYRHNYADFYRYEYKHEHRYKHADVYNNRNFYSDADAYFYRYIYTFADAHKCRKP
jgi:hypothetical protein